MEENQSPFAEQQQIIMDAVKKAEEQGNKRKAEEESALRANVEQLEDFEAPDDLEDPGRHSLEEMGVLARIGKMTRSFPFHGNQIQLRTLQTGEELEILSRCDAFPPLAQSKAYVIYTTAVSIETVNGMPYFERLPLGPKDDMYSHKFKHFLDLSPTVINKFIEEYNILRQEAEEEGRYAKKE